eukprot:6192006-Pleurochrysis_carterae.AAC.3
MTGGSLWTLLSEPGTVETGTSDMTQKEQGKEPYEHTASQGRQKKECRQASHCISATAPS